jgi:hypothetical protein
VSESEHQDPTECESETETRGGDEESTPESPKRVREIGGPTGPEPTRYGDWERKGRCSDF